MKLVFKLSNLLFLISMLLFACGQANTDLPTQTPIGDSPIGATETLISPSQTATPSKIVETIAPTLTPTTNEVFSNANVEDITQLYDPFPVQFRLVTEIATVNGTPYLIEVLHDEIIEIHNIAKGTLVARIEEEEAQIEQIVVSQDGRLLAAISPGQKKVTFWDLETLEKLHELALEGFPRYRSSSPIDGTFSSSNKLFVVWGCQTPDLPSCASSRVIVYDLSENKVLSLLNGLQRHTSRVLFANDNSQIVVVGEGEQLAHIDLLVWDLDTDQEMHRLTCSDCEQGYGFSDGIFIHNGTEFLAKFSNRLFVFDAQNWQIIDVWEFPRCSTPYQMKHIEGSDLVLGIACISHVVFLGTVDGVILRNIDLGTGYIDDIYIDNDLRIIYIISDVGYLENDLGEIEYLLGGSGFVSQWGLP